MNVDDTDDDGSGSAADDAASERSRMRASTAVFASATAVSRAAGLAREVVVAAAFGVSAAMSAFTIAFQIPNLIRSLVADAALNASFVPVFTDLRERGEDERAWRVASSLLALIVLLLVPLTLLVMVFAEPIVGIFTSSSFSETDLAVTLFRIMMPTVLLMALSGVIVGILSSFDHFSVPALAPIAWNVIIILTVAFGVRMVDGDAEIMLYAGAVLLGTLVQFALPIPWLRGTGGRLYASIDLSDPELRRILKLMLPVTLSLGLVNITLLINTYFATKIPASLLPGDGAGPAVLDKAFRIYMLPQGIFSVAIATVFFPALARYASRGDNTSFNTTFARGLRQIFILLVPASMVMAALAFPITRLLFERGAFTATDTHSVGLAVIGFSLGVSFNGALLLLFRAFFSRKSPWVATMASLGGLIANTLLVALLYDQGVFAIAAVVSTVNATMFVALYAYAHTQFGNLDTLRTIRIVLLTALVGIISTAAGWAVWYLVDSVLGRGLVTETISMAAALTVIGALYAGGLLIVRVLTPESLRAMLGRA